MVSKGERVKAASQHAKCFGSAMKMPDNSLSKTSDIWANKPANCTKVINRLCFLDCEGNLAKVQLFLKWKKRKNFFFKIKAFLTHNVSINLWS